MSTETKARLQQIGVLIVDDDPALRRMIAMVLEDEEWTVLEAPDGPEALAVLRSHLSHLVVLVDGRLPTMTGEEVLLAVRADPQLMARHAFVMVSGNALTPSPHLSKLLRELGVTVIAKPFSIDELLRTIESQARRLATAGEEAV
jgi:CheY-like chemotaxis protein